jgi:hypothetical protein
MEQAVKKRASKAISDLSDRPLLRYRELTPEQELELDGAVMPGYARARAQHLAHRHTITELAKNGLTLREIVAATKLHTSYVVRVLAFVGFRAAPIS